MAAMLRRLPPLTAQPRLSAPRGRRVRRLAVRATSASVALGESGVELPRHSVAHKGGLGGAALNNISLAAVAYPSKKEVFEAIPPQCLERDTRESLAHAFKSLVLTLACGAVGATAIPLTLAAAPLWVAYAAVTGTVATGCWVTAHECGHGAFSDNKALQDAVGYALHSALLVPYFSWQRSHAVHHARTNHMTEGETHVPPEATSQHAAVASAVKRAIGQAGWGVVNGFAVLGFGWPMYLLRGASGGPVRGATNHFVPTAGVQGRHCLFPGGWKNKVWQSDIGVAATLAALVAWGTQAGAAKVLCVYGLPYLVVNAWLVGYTLLQHTDVDVPHYDADHWSWAKGAFLTIDRPYGKLIDWLHHSIGSTHVAHHVNHAIPHYRAREATEALKEAFPSLYLYDPTPVHKAAWRVLSSCVAVAEAGKGAFVFVDDVA